MKKISRAGYQSLVDESEIDNIELNEKNNVHTLAKDDSNHYNNEFSIGINPSMNDVKIAPVVNARSNKFCSYFLLASVSLILLTMSRYVYRKNNDRDKSKMLCPGSPAFIHASCQMSASFGSDCAAVIKEITDRVDANKNGTWYYSSIF